MIRDVTEGSRIDNIYKYKYKSEKSKSEPMSDEQIGRQKGEDK